MLGLCSLVLVDGGLYWLVFIVSRKRLAYTACFSLVLLDGRPMMACVLWFKSGWLHKPIENIEGVLSKFVRALSHMTIHMVCI